MLKKLLFAVTGVVFFLAPASLDALAQSDTPKVEAGVLFSFIRFRDLDTTGAGFGGRLTYNVNDSVGIEGELNYFPSDKQGVFESGKKTQGLFGVKTGLRSETAGIFGKIRPGFVRFSRDFDGFEDSKTDFALDVGGVIEVYPSTASVVRFDIGDTIIRFGERTVSDVFGNPVTFNSFTSHNLQVSIGVGVRF
ncbi:MAG TPA: outer membrane beta-barrel protein [Blastocatellia bacterium]|nr:outer membrane beta-barrel protein [Blastocatellia bacterium]